MPTWRTGNSRPRSRSTQTRSSSRSSIRTPGLGRAFYRRDGGQALQGAFLALLCLFLLPRQLAAAETGRVVEVVDGDTLRIRAGSGDTATVRLIGIDAPEKAHPEKGREFGAAESWAFLRSLCDERMVRLEPGADDKDGYGRLLRYVYLPALAPSDGEEILVNREMVRRGQARAMRRFPHSLSVDFLAAEELARREALGIWADRGLAELRWLRDSGAEAVEIWPAADARFVVVHRGLAKPAVGRAELAASVDGILRVHREFAGEVRENEAERVGFLRIAGSPSAAQSPAAVPRAAEAGASAGSAVSPAVVSWELAGQYVGRTVTVEGKIVRASRGKKVLFLNFHPNWKKHLTVVIPGGDLRRFPDDAERRYNGRVVRVTGEVALYKGRLEIVVRSPDALAVVR